MKRLMRDDVESGTSELKIICDFLPFSILTKRFLKGSIVVECGTPPEERL